MKQERWKSILKPLTILPVIVMLCTIFGFSNQNGTTSGGLSQKVSRQIVTVCDTLFHQDLAEETIEHYTEKIEYPLRKAAHATEYLILTLLAALPFYTYGLRGKKLLLALFLFCVICASGDEFHQSFIPGRSPQITDVFVDSIGILTGCGITYYVIARPMRLLRRSVTHRRDSPPIPAIRTGTAIHADTVVGSAYFLYPSRKRMWIR